MIKDVLNKCKKTLQDHIYIYIYINTKKLWKGGCLLTKINNLSLNLMKDWRECY